MTRTHGHVRGSLYVPRSSIEHGRFGRMFRSLDGETYENSDLLDLAKLIIQRETAIFRDLSDAGQMTDPPNKDDWREGPDTIFHHVPFKNDAGDTVNFLDTAYGEPEPGDENPIVPAGYTYFGQFIDHDLTFDPNSSLQKLNDPDATDDFRTPRFDLDSLYGRGPDDQPYLYQDPQSLGGGIRFLLGVDAAGASRPGELPRNADGRALTGDPRNDENGIICQLQVIFLHFHNKVVDTLEPIRKQLGRHALFQEAQRIVRWHYQYLILNDYLPRIVGEETWKKVYHGSGSGTHPQPNVRFYKPNDGQAYMPVEFSVAAFRFGHSMVRPSYALRRGDTLVGGGVKTTHFDGDKRFHRIPIFSDKVGTAVSLNGFGKLPANWEIDWNMFFCAGKMPTQMTTSGNDKGVLGVSPQTSAQMTQPSYRIDTQLVDPLAMLPFDVAKSGNMPDGIPSLAYRNLLRGSMFELPSGQSVARALGAQVLDEDKLWGFTKGGPRGNRDFSDATINPFAYRAPLWYYILREAELTFQHGVTDGKGGHHLGAVGGTVVAEVIVGIVLNDRLSFLSQDGTWTPAAEEARSGFKTPKPIKTMFDLIEWTTGGTMRF